MSSSKKTPLDRVKQYSKTNPGTFSADKATLFCKICSKSVDHTRKCVIDAHLASKVHQSNLAVTKETPPIVQAFTATSSRLSQWSDLVGAFTSAGVPLHVFDNEGIRNWFQKYANNGGNLPSVSTLRRNLTDVGTWDLQTTIDICKGRDVVAIVDESTDIKNRKVLNVLLKPLVKGAKARLVGSSVVNKCDAVSVANAVLKTIQLVDVSTDNLVRIKTDNAAYMKLPGETLKGCCRRLVNSICWSHVLHLLAEDVRGTFQLVDKCIANLKASLEANLERQKHNVIVNLLTFPLRFENLISLCIKNSGSSATMTVFSIIDPRN